MPYSTIEKNINGHHYSVSTYPATEALKIKYKLLSFIQPILSDLLVANFGDVDIKDLSKEDLMLLVVTALRQLLTQLGADDDKKINSLLDLIHRIFSTTKCDGQDLSNKVIFDNIFANNFVEMYDAIYLILTINFKGFFLEIFTKFQSLTSSQNSKSQKSNQQLES